MMIENLKRGGWRKRRKAINYLLGIARKWENLRIVRTEPGMGDSVLQGTDSVTLRLERAVVSEAAGASSSLVTFPLQPIISGEDRDKVKFRYGTVHGLVPSIGGDAITVDLANEDNPEITVTGAGVIYVKVDLAESTYEAENPVFQFVEGDETDIPEDVARVSAHHLLVGVEWDDNADGIKTLSPVHQGSIDVASCAGVSNYWDLG